MRNTLISRLRAFGGPSVGGRGAKAWSFGLKAAGTTAILTYLFWRVDLAQFVAALRESISGWLALAFVTNLLGLVTSTWKWHVLLRALGIRCQRFELLKLYTIGFFASRFLPGVIGGDVVRWHMSSARVGHRLQVAATILLERGTGLVALLVLSVPAAFVIVPGSARLTVLAFVGGVAGALILAILIALSRRIAVGLAFRMRRTRLVLVTHHLFKLHRAIRRVPPKPLGVALLFSVGFYASMGLSFYLICRAFGFDISYLQAFSVQTLIALLVLIPISLGGLGLAQAGDVYLLGLLGLGIHAALAISIMRVLINYGYAVIGGLLFVNWQATPEATTRAQELSAAPEGRV